MSGRDYLLYGLVVFAWSTSWLPLKWQVGIVAPEVSIFWRFVIAASLSFGIALYLRLPLRFSPSLHLYLALMGLCLFSVNFALFYYASSGVASGLLALVFSTAAIINILLVAALSWRWPRALQIVAALMGFSGLALIYWSELDLSEAALTSLMLSMSGTLIFCIGNMASVATQKRGVAVISANCWGMLYGAMFLGLFAGLRGQPFIIEQSLKYIGGLIWLAVFSSVIAFSCYLTLVGRIGPARAAYATVMFPLLALLISTVFESYHWTSLAFIGVGLALIGNLVMIRAR